MEPDRPDQTTALACCADLYQSDLARLLLGDSLHPGGLRLTHRLGTLMGIQPDDWVVDLACGRGISGMAVSRTFRCKVAGIEYGVAAVAEAHAGRGKRQSRPAPSSSTLTPGCRPLGRPALMLSFASVP